jgi:hypothetical protein
VKLKTMTPNRARFVLKGGIIRWTNQTASEFLDEDGRTSQRQPRGDVRWRQVRKREDFTGAAGLTF